jgi:uncharacterized protein YndB with AHSA1/START domain
MAEIKKAYEIHAPVSEVWEALVNPDLIKQYFFGTEAISDWKEGSRITYKGEWEGKSYEDKGIILKLIPEKLLTINYWSNRSGKPDSPENYSPHSYVLDEAGTSTLLTIVQEGDPNAGEEKLKKSWGHWDMAMDGLKKLLEGKEKAVGQEN